MDGLESLNLDLHVDLESENVGLRLVPVHLMRLVHMCFEAT